MLRILHSKAEYMNRLIVLLSAISLPPLKNSYPLTNSVSGDEDYHDCCGCDDTLPDSSPPQIYALPLVSDSLFEDEGARSF